MRTGQPAADDVRDTPVVLDGTSDRDAEFTAFVRRCAADLGRTAWFLCGNQARAEDLVQQALLRTYLAWPRAREVDTLAYARRVLVNARIDAWRKSRHELIAAPREAVDPARSHAELHAERDLLMRALARLSARQRRIVVLRHLLDLSEAEVAEDLGVSLGTVKSTASRGLRQLRELLSEGVSESAPGATQRELP